MRHPNTFKQFSKVLPGSVLCSLMLLLGACAELSLTTPTPAANANAQAAAVTAPAPTSVQFAAPPATPTAVTTTVIALPTATAIPTASPAPTLTPVPLPQTATVAPTATALPPTATKVLSTVTKPPSPKTVPATSLAGSKGDNQDLAFVAVNGNIVGKDASVTIQTVPSRECSIEYVTPNRQPSTAKGLETKVADLDGRITWKWTIGTGTKTGKGSVKVTCGDASESRQIIIG